MNFSDAIRQLPKDSVKTEPSLEFRSVALDQFRFPDSLFDPQSIEDVYVHIEPLVPIIVYQSSGHFTVIDGCKRLMSAQKKGFEECLCGIVTPSPDNQGAALLRIILNCRRKLSFREKYLFIGWLKKNCSMKQYSEICKLLSPDKTEIFEFEQLLLCDKTVFEAVACGALEACLAPEANSLEQSDRSAILDFFRRYRFSRQTQRELLEWLPELAFRENRSVRELLNSEWLKQIENNEKLNGPQKIEHICTAIFNRRFPLLARTKAFWKDLAATLNPDPSNVTFRHYEAFEKNRLEIKVSLSSAAEAKNIFSRLSGISEQQWSRLIYPVILPENEHKNL